MVLYYLNNSIAERREGEAVVLYLVILVEVVMVPIQELTVYFSPGGKKDNI